MPKEFSIEPLTPALVRRPLGLFLTGTDTNVGKTHIAALILSALKAAGHSVGAYKPVCTGAILDANQGIRWDDIERLKAALGEDCPDEAICSQRFLAPMAPPVAARAEGRVVDFGRLVSGVEWWHGKVELLVVEGVGGILAPVAQRETVADLAVAIGYPVLIVARCGLGTINHTLLTIEAARKRGLRLAGIVLNQSSLDDDLVLAESNAAEIEARAAVPVLGILDWDSPDGLHRHGRPVTIPWSKLAAD